MRIYHDVRSLNKANLGYTIRRNLFMNNREIKMACCRLISFILLFNVITILPFTLRADEQEPVQVTIVWHSGGLGGKSKGHIWTMDNLKQL